jgi:Uma2 family endonuclease
MDTMTVSISQPLSVRIPPRQQWHQATWQDYLAVRDAIEEQGQRLFFNQGWMELEMGGEGINHASINNLFVALLFFWAAQHPEQIFNTLGGCLLEKPQTQACSPDLVLYLGEEVPVWQEGEPRVVDLTRWRVPDLVGEVSDTTLTTDLDAKKHLYAALGVPEYWVIDVRGRRVFAFGLQEKGEYHEIEASIALQGLSIALLNQTLERLPAHSNTAAAAWFLQQISAPQP